MIMERGKRICNVLKDVRKKIAEENEIEYVTTECQHKGDCAGTCPKCEAEVRYLESQLARRRMAGRTVRLAGLSLGMVAVAPALVSCDVKGDLAVDGEIGPPLAGDPAIPENVQLGENLIFDLIPAEEFIPLFKGGWVESEVYDVYPDGKLGKEILSNIDGYVPRRYSVQSDEEVKEYISSDADPDLREYRMHQYAYSPYSNSLMIGNALSLTVASIDEDRMECYGEVFSRNWAPDAFMGKYVFTRVSDETVAEWDAAYTTPKE